DGSRPHRYSGSPDRSRTRAVRATASGARGENILMSRQMSSSTVRVSLADWIVDEGPNEEPRYAISVVAARCGVRTSTLRRYEEWGLVEPARTGQRRLYSD